MLTLHLYLYGVPRHFHYAEIRNSRYASMMRRGIVETMLHELLSGQTIQAQLSIAKDALGSSSDARPQAHHV
jgi:hypothetical protein